MKIAINSTFITDDSRECAPGCYFLDDGHNSAHAAAALAAGANVIKEPAARELLGISPALKIIGITGTNGKTTTAAAIYSALLDLGAKALLIGTRGVFCCDEQIAEKSLTTPFLLAFLGHLKTACERGCEFVITEISSHAIAQNRYGAAVFAARVLTNITQDHLDFHGTLDAYAACKAEFFAAPGLKIINADARAIPYEVRGAITYALDAPARYSCAAFSLAGGIEAVFKDGTQAMQISSPLLGKFNVYNLLAACATLCELLRGRFTPEQIAAALGNFAGCRGRCERANVPQDVVIDFAHTPDGIRAVCEALGDKPLIVVVGAGGDRDRSKRAEMANIAAHYARTLIITSDNPRSENPLAIAADMLEGLNAEQLGICHVIISRRAAIKYALKAARKNERVLILGKGDESTQEIGGKKLPFSDAAVVCELARELEIEDYKERERFDVSRI